jgi:hypothetical protein
MSLRDIVLYPYEGYLFSCVKCKGIADFIPGDKSENLIPVFR